MSGLLLGGAWALGTALPAFLWQALGIHCAMAALLSLTRPRDARLRYALCCAGLLLCVAMFAADVAHAYRALPAAGLADAASPLWSGTWPLWCAMAWLGGAALAALRVWAGMAWLRRLLRASQPWTDAAWQARVAGLARRMRLRREVGLRLVRGLCTPMTAGWFKPVLLVPANLVTGMPPDLLEALLAHELAHVRRHDYLVNLLQFAAEILLFFHPTVWWLSRRIRIERERIADDMAAALIGQPRRLALALNALSQDADAAPAPVAPAARDGDLLDRIRRLTRPDSLPARRAVAMPALAAMLAVAIAGAGGQAGPADDGRADAARRALAQLPGIDALIQSSGASHVLVLDARSGDTLVGVAENEAVPIASLTKLMTAMVLLDAAPDLSQPVRIDERDAEAARGGAWQLPVGAVAPLDTMLKLALMSSDNRAAHALARSYPGGEAAFARALRRKVAALGLEHARFEDAMGISPSNRASAADIGRIVSAATAYPQIALDTTSLDESVGMDAGAIQYRNTNPLVGRQGWDIRLSKTATSAEAGRCLAMRVQAGGRELTLVLLNGRALPA